MDGSAGAGLVAGAPAVAPARRLIILADFVPAQRPPVLGDLRQVAVVSLRIVIGARKFREMLKLHPDTSGG
jgi:hypothetical protein